jgi:hypothetical protein
MVREPHLPDHLCLPLPKQAREEGILGAYERTNNESALNAFILRRPSRKN